MSFFYVECVLQNLLGILFFQFGQFSCIFGCIAETFSGIVPALNFCCGAPVQHIMHDDDDDIDI